jgi:hypothetical protein
MKTPLPDNRECTQMHADEESSRLIGEHSRLFAVQNANKKPGAVGRNLQVRVVLEADEERTLQGAATAD